MQTQNHYMVIITIPKFMRKVNDFQIGFHNLLILNNRNILKLGNVTIQLSAGYFMIQKENG